jgi:hypothetical protein
LLCISDGEWIDRPNGKEVEEAIAVVMMCGIITRPINSNREAMAVAVTLGAPTALVIIATDQDHGLVHDHLIEADAAKRYKNGGVVECLFFTELNRFSSTFRYHRNWSVLVEMLLQMLMQPNARNRLIDRLQAKTRDMNHLTGVDMQRFFHILFITDLLSLIKCKLMFAHII